MMIAKFYQFQFKVGKTEIINRKQTRVGFNRPMTQHENILPNNKNVTPSKMALDTDSHSAQCCKQTQQAEQLNVIMLSSMAPYGQLKSNNKRSDLTS
jgi:hypothetical protein